MCRRVCWWRCGSVFFFFFTPRSYNKVSLSFPLTMMRYGMLFQIVSYIVSYIPVDGIFFCRYFRKDKKVLMPLGITPIKSYSMYIYIYTNLYCAKHCNICQSGVIRTGVIYIFYGTSNIIPSIYIDYILSLFFLFSHFVCFYVNLYFVFRLYYDIT